MMRLRQIALVARDLEAACADIRAVLGCSYAYDDPGVGKYGLRNAVFPLGGTFLEVVSPRQDGTAAGRLLTKRGGDGGYMVIVQTGDLAGARARVQAAGIRIADQMDLPGASFTHLHPKDLGGAILSIDAMTPPDHWEWGGPCWRDHAADAGPCVITGATLQVADPAAAARRWSEALGAEDIPDGADRLIALAGGTLRFQKIQDARGEGLASFSLSVRDADAVRRAAAARGLIARGGIMLAGTRVDLHTPSGA